MQLGRSSVSLADLVQAQLLQPGQELIYRRNPDSRARLTAEGTITFDGRDYPSPSAAARAAANGVSTNGWKAWCVDVDGRNVDLAAIRSQLLASSAQMT